MRPGIIILIGIVIIVLSFTLWYYIIPPFTSLSRNSASLASAAAGKITFLTSNSTSPSTVYFGAPIDDSFNLSMTIGVTNGSVSVTVYVRDKVCTVQTNSTIQTIVFSSSLYNNASASRPPKSIIFPNVTAVVPSSLLDAFTGGATPYMVIRNLNASETSVSYTYSYSESFRNSDGIPLLLFVIGAVIIIVYGIVFVRRFIRHPRDR